MKTFVNTLSPAAPPARLAPGALAALARRASAALARRASVALARRASVALAALAALAASGCGGGDFEPASRVAKLRVLAVRADPPFARPGEEVRLEALAVDPAGRELRWGWSSCFEPGGASALACLGAAPPAEGAPEGEPSAPALAGAWSVRVPDDALAPPNGPTRASATLGVNLVVCPGAITAGPTKGVPVGCVDAGGRALGLDEFEVGTKRVTVRAADRNENPLVEAALWEGADWPEAFVPEVDACDEGGNDFDACGEAFARRISLALGPPERGVDELGVDFEEQQIVQYYASEGIFEDEVRAAPSVETRWVARRASAGARITFWLVARDDRGGVAWVTRQVQVR